MEGPQDTLERTDYGTTGSEFASDLTINYLFEPNFGASVSPSVKINVIPLIQNIVVRTRNSKK